MRTWHCFQVVDYKGGELRSRVNLSTYKLIEYLDDICGDGNLLYALSKCSLSDVDNEDTIRELIDLFTMQCNDEDALYAGYLGYTNPEIYVSEGGRLKESFPTDEEIKGFIIRYLKSHQDESSNK